MSLRSAKRPWLQRGSVSGDSQDRLLESNARWRLPGIGEQREGAPGDGSSSLSWRSRPSRPRSRSPGRPRPPPRSRTTGVVVINTNLSYASASAAGTGMVISELGRGADQQPRDSRGDLDQVVDPATGRRYAAHVVGYAIASGRRCAEAREHVRSGDRLSRELRGPAARRRGHGGRQCGRHRPSRLGIRDDHARSVAR